MVNFDVGHLLKLPQLLKIPELVRVKKKFRHKNAYVHVLSKNGVAEWTSQPPQEQKTRVRIPTGCKVFRKT
jgi:hypothetical protein